MHKKIIIITSGHFPEGDAGAIRLLMVAKALEAANYQVSVFCRGESRAESTIDGIKYKSLRYRDGNTIINCIEYGLFPMRVKKEIEVQKPDCIYIYNAHLSIFKFCKIYACRHNIKLIHDCVEWYSPEQFPEGKKDYWYNVKNKVNTEVIDQNFSVIAISSFLEKYFSSKGIKTIRVPVLCDSETRRCSKELHDESLELFYAGSPTRKDLIGNLLEAITLLTEEEKKKIHLTLVGPTVETLSTQSAISPELIEKCKNEISILGRKKRAEVLEHMENADFTVLPRDAEQRYAQAGFPSKVVESLANATPIFCNYSSDLSLYLKDGYNAVIAENHSVEALLEAIRKALEFSPEKKQQLSKNALQTAVSEFDFRLYAEKLKIFIES